MSTYGVLSRGLRRAAESNVSPCRPCDMRGRPAGLGFTSRGGRAIPADVEHPETVLGSPSRPTRAFTQLATLRTSREGAGNSGTAGVDRSGWRGPRGQRPRRVPALVRLAGLEGVTTAARHRFLGFAGRGRTESGERVCASALLRPRRPALFSVRRSGQRTDYVPASCALLRPRRRRARRPPCSGLAVIFPTPGSTSQ